MNGKKDGQTDTGWVGEVLGGSGSMAQRQRNLRWFTHFCSNFLACLCAFLASLRAMASAEMRGGHSCGAPHTLGDTVRFLNNSWRRGSV